MASTVSKTRIAELTREIRREAKHVDNLVERVAGGRNGLPKRDIPVALASLPHTRELLQEALNIIDGNSALIRSLLDLEG